jgi:imidazole glycerol-phosphate synthase subunit HisF
MTDVRVIPCLLLDGSMLVKTVKFKSGAYVGDPVNTVRIFNELEVDELCILDISATPTGRGPDLGLLAEIASEAFMPLSYGGGLRDVATAGRLLRVGFEKVVVNTAAVERPPLVQELSRAYGGQAVVVAIDVKKRALARYEVVTRSARRRTGLDPIEWAVRAVELGAGEILLTSVDRDGTWTGYDLALVRAVTNRVSVPVIANGGAGSVEHLGEVVRHSGASAVALGSMVVFQAKGLGVLVNFPDQGLLRRELQAGR